MRRFGRWGWWKAHPTALSANPRRRSI